MGMQGTKSDITIINSRISTISYFLYYKISKFLTDTSKIEIKYLYHFYVELKNSVQIFKTLILFLFVD